MNQSFVIYGQADWSVGRVKRDFAQMREIKDWRSLKVLANGIFLREKYLLTDYHVQNGYFSPQKFHFDALLFQFVLRPIGSLHFIEIRCLSLPAAPTHLNLFFISFSNNQYHFFYDST